MMSSRSAIGVPPRTTKLNRAMPSTIVVAQYFLNPWLLLMNVSSLLASKHCCDITLMLVLDRISHAPSHDLALDLVPVSVKAATTLNLLIVTIANLMISYL